MWDLLSGLPKETWALIGAASAVIAPPIIVGIKESIFESKKANKERLYMSVQLIFVLDKFTADCAHVAYDDGYPDGCPPVGHAVAQVQTPTFDLSNVKGEAKHLNANFIYKLHKIEIKKIQIAGRLSDEALFDDPPYMTAYFELRRQLYGELGLYTAKLIKEICREYKIKHDTWGDGWTPEEAIKQTLAAMKTRRSKAIIRSKQWKAQMVMKEINK
ncbi:hypothetical protein [Klebsiella variicola]|uniref:hypothetical protein n=1 Tax=Klebsiella variicola TaxID=244366 RepID=UPI000E2CCC71|nr:hypothetical protein [Klebsiella variicola]SXF39247.1 Uncharacterised protein [Klebsiella variicola]